MNRRILLVDDDLAVLLTLKAVLELHGFEVETAASSAEAFARMQSGVYQMVISDLRMETEEAGLEVIRMARSQPYDPATALLTAYPPSIPAHGENAERVGVNKGFRSAHDRDEESSDSLLIKPLGTTDLLRQIEALLIRQADRQQHRQAAVLKAQETTRQSG